MGFFSRKEKSAEEKLVNELVGAGLFGSDNLSDVLDSAVSQNELQKIVKKAWKNGASVTEIQKVYEENLNRLQDSIENKEINFIKSKNKNEFRKEGNLKAKKELLEKYPNIDGLDQIIQTSMEVMGSNVMKNLAQNLKKYNSIFATRRFSRSTLNTGIKNEFPPVNYAYTILDEHKIFLGDTITEVHYDYLILLVFQILYYRGKEISNHDVYPMAHKIMVLLNDFDKEISYNEPDESFFNNLKKIKWDKNAEKFFDEVKDIYDTSMIETIGRISFIRFSLIHVHVLELLGACNAVINQRTVIKIEDVIVAFKTYFKFCDLKLAQDGEIGLEVLEKDVLEQQDELNQQAIVPEVIEDFLHKTKLKADNVVNLTSDYKNVSIVKEKFRGRFSLDAWIYMAEVDEIFQSIIEDFGIIVYEKHNYYYRIGPRAVKLWGDHRESVFTIFFVKRLFEEDLPKIIKKDWMLGQVDKAMIFNIENNTLYGKNGVHMKEFKKIIEEWGIIENCNNNDYFKVKIL